MVERCEKRWIWAFALMTLALTSLPYLIGYWAQGNNYQFLGFIFGVDDGNSYIAKMLAGATGDWLFRSPYTAYPQSGAFSFFPYLLLGKLSAPPGQHDQLVFLYQLFRWAGGFLVILATYDFVALFIQRKNYRRLATAMVTLGGGMGWLFALGLSGLWQERIPLEFYSPETFGFLSVLGLPHLEVARACLLWGLRAYLLNTREFSFRRAVNGGLLWLIMGFFQPLTVVTGWAILGLHVVVVSISRNIKDFHPFKIIASSECTRILTAVGMVVISAPIVFYTLIAFNTDPFLKNWTSQNRILSPPILDYLLAFLNILPFSIAGIVMVFRKKEWDACLPALWVLIFPLLAYAPYNLQRRLPEGTWVALVILAFIVIENQLARFQKPIRAWAGLAFFSTIIFFVGAVFTVVVPKSPLFVSQNEKNAFSALGELAQKDDVVLADFRISNELPAWLPVRTVVGHGPESIHASQLTAQVDSFLSTSGQDSERLDLIREFNIKYIVLGPEEQGGSYWKPGGSDFIELVYQDVDFKIYRVQIPN
jgi:hypothetical protein